MEEDAGDGAVGGGWVGDEDAAMLGDVREIKLGFGGDVRNRLLGVC